MKKLIIAFCLLPVFSAQAQQQLFLDLIPKSGQQELFLNTEMKDFNGVNMSVEYFNYYLSDLHLIHDGGQDLDLSDTVFIVFSDNHRLDLGLQSVTNLEAVRFSIGVPLDLNHTDISAYPDKHPLSFQNPSMQWGWTDGYMFMIVGGMSDADGDGTSETVFQAHGFGDNNYFNTTVSTGLTPIDASSSEIKINCNLDHWLAPYDLRTFGIKHGSTNENAGILKNITKRPVFNTDQSAGMTAPESQGSIQHTAINGMLDLSWQGIGGLHEMQVVDEQGRLIASIKGLTANGTHQFKVPTAGVYLLRYADVQGKMLGQLKTFVTM